MAADPRLTPRGHQDRPKFLNTVRIRVAQLVEALRYKPEGLGFDSRLEFFIDIILRAALSPWGLLSL
jgi:hypothetical protein